MMLLSDDTLYSFLGGTVASVFNKQPNDFLKYSLINWVGDNHYFILGGEHENNDGICKYKKSFPPNDIEAFYKEEKLLIKSSMPVYLIFIWQGDRKRERSSEIYRLLSNL